MKKIFTFLFLLLFILLPFGQVEVIPLGIPTASVYIHDVIIGVIIIISCIAFGKEIVKLRLPFVVPMLLFILFGLIGLIINPLKLTYDQWIIASAYLLRFSLYFALYPIVVVLCQKKILKNELILWLLWGWGIVLTLFGYIQYFLYPNLRNLYYLGWDPHEYRLFSTLFDPNYLGVVLIFTLFLGFYLLRTIFSHPERNEVKSKDLLKVGRTNMSFTKSVELYFSQRFLRSSADSVGMTLILILVFFALILTYSRGSYVAFVIALLFTFINKKTWKILFGVIALVAIFIILLPRPGGEGVKLERISTILSRKESYEEVTSIITKYPLTGVGFNAYRYAKKSMGYLTNEELLSHSGSGADNSLLFAWATAGIGGFISLVWFYGKLLVSLFKEKSKNNFSLVILGSTVALFVSSFFINSLFYPFILIWFWILLGVYEMRKDSIKAI